MVLDKTVVFHADPQDLSDKRQRKFYLIPLLNFRSNRRIFNYSQTLLQNHICNQSKVCIKNIIPQISSFICSIQLCYISHLFSSFYPCPLIHWYRKDPITEFYQLMRLFFTFLSL